MGVQPGPEHRGVGAGTGLRPAVRRSLCSIVPVNWDLTACGLVDQGADEELTAAQAHSVLERGPCYTLNMSI